MQLRLGPEIYEKLRFSLPDEMYDGSNKGLIKWFQIQLYQIPAEEFLKIIGDVISSDESKNRRATARFEEIMREAQELKSEYDNWKEENGEDQSDDDNSGNNDDDDGDDDLDDFLSGLGISMPK
jgi:regulator of RNase E activity RraB